LPEIHVIQVEMCCGEGVRVGLYIRGRSTELTDIRYMVSTSYRRDNEVTFFAVVWVKK